ncbi:hypothetical protein [Paenibacillus sp. OSY-SE]|uniref:hypothetical protein n=1 Tax=Paenibacillus sp. OSY-SE TaxID=1196323 RepID=UPI0003195ED4
MIGWLILACEIGFWVFILLGLFARYRLRQRTLGSVLLFCTPLIDILLIVFTIIDLKNGAAATTFHGLAAVYVGVSIAFGKRMIQWADDRFAHLFAGAPRPLSLPSSMAHNTPNRNAPAGIGMFSHGRSASYYCLASYITWGMQIKQKAC